tara:strand:- start:35 stop:397 length:363 start_codon:yes stop_codon:yes gene_type:complete
MHIARVSSTTFRSSRQYRFPYRIWNKESEAKPIQKLWEDVDPYGAGPQNFPDCFPKNGFDVKERMLELLGSLGMKQAHIAHMDVSAYILEARVLNDQSRNIENWDAFEALLERTFCLEVR